MVDFYFDFTSPYAYLASERIEVVAARYGRTVRMLPTLLGVAFRQSGQRPLTDIPLKGDYSLRDITRSARHHGIPLTMPGRFPVPTVDAARGVLWLERERPEAVPAYVHAVFRAYFTRGEDISSRDVVAGLLADLGFEREAALAGIGDPAVKEGLRQRVEDSIARGVFGAPFIIVDGEPFWGNDRFEQIERWLAFGPF
jgi:2-hydroxychromene-2-carboxylate isomerase